MCAITEKFRMCCGSTRVLYRRRLSIFQRTVALRVLGADVFGARADEPIVGVLLEHVRRPAGYAADGEDRREQLDGDAQRVIGRRRTEIEVGIEPPLRPDERFDLLRPL